MFPDKTVAFNENPSIYRWNAYFSASKAYEILDQIRARRANPNELIYLAWKLANGPFYEKNGSQRSSKGSSYKPYAIKTNEGFHKDRCQYNGLRFEQIIQELYRDEGWILEKGFIISAVHPWLICETDGIISNLQKG